MKKYLGFGALVIAIAGYYFSNRTQEKVVEETVEEIQQTQSHDHSHKKVKTLFDKKKDKKQALPSKPSQEQVKLPDFKPKNKDEENLLKVAEVYGEVFKEKMSSKDFADKLKKAGLKPTISSNTNPYTGSMRIVRTINNLEGSRYVHGQFFVDENGNEFPQHASVEFRKGPGQLKKVANSWAKLLGIEEPPKMENGTFISYKLTDSYTIWFKQMGLEDLKDDPFNAYTEKDVGTIRMAIEMEIHGDEHDSHVFPDGN